MIIHISFMQISEKISAKMFFINTIYMKLLMFKFFRLLYVFVGNIFAKSFPRLWTEKRSVSSKCLFSLEPSSPQ